MSIVFIASIIDVAGFSLTALAGVVGLSCSSHSVNRLFFYTFYCLIILISALQIAIGTINFFADGNNLNWLLFIEQIINNFSLVSQLAIILTIAYGWSVTSCKLQEDYEKSLDRLSRKRHIFIGTTVALLVAVCIATAGVVVYAEV